MSSVCDTMAEVASSTYLRTVLFVSLFFSVISIPVGIFSTITVCKTQRIHFNTKCLFTTLNLAVLVHCTSRIILNSTNIVEYYSSFKSGCDILPSRTRCFLRIPYKTAQYVIEMSSILLTAERVLATFHNQNYENRFKPFGVFLSFFQVILATIIVFFQISKRAAEPLYYCAVVAKNETALLLFPDIIICAVQIATIPVLLYLLKKNLKYRQTKITSNLSRRYQISENLRTIRIFRTFSIMTAIYVWTSGGASVYIHEFVPNETRANIYANIEAVQFIPIYFLIMFSIIYIQEKRQKAEMFKMIVETSHHHAQYFMGLQKTFDDAFDQKIESKPKINLKRCNKVSHE